MSKVLGRICARGKDIGGVYIPFKNSNLKGIYELIENSDGTISVNKIGDPNIDNETLFAADLQYIIHRKPKFFMIEEEYDNAELKENINNSAERHKYYILLLNEMYDALDREDKEDFKEKLNKLREVLGTCPEVIRAERLGIDEWDE